MGKPFRSGVKTATDRHVRVTDDSPTDAVRQLETGKKGEKSASEEMEKTGKAHKYSIF